MERRDFLKAVGFTIIVPQFGQMFRQGSGIVVPADVPQSVGLTRTIVLARGETYEQAIANFAKRLGRMSAGMYSFEKTDQRGVHKLQPPPDLGAFSVRGQFAFNPSGGYGPPTPKYGKRVTE